MMNTFTTYSNLAETVASSIKGNFGAYSKLDNSDIEALDSMFKVRISSELHGTKGRMIRNMLRLFGIVVKCGKVYVTVKNKRTLLMIISQIEPLLKYFSKEFIAKLTVKINSEKTVDSNSSETVVKFVSSLAEKNRLTDYIMENISDKQYEIENKRQNCVNSLSRNSKFSKDCDDSDSVQKVCSTSSSNKEAALKEEVQRLKKQLEKRDVSSGSDELFIERLENSITSVAPSLRFISEKWKGDKTFNHEESATEVLHISDWHIGEVDNVGGLNQFNYKIACDRVKTLTNKVISWTKMHRSMYSVDELVIIATGDMISGDIHDELRATNEFPAPEQCVKAAMLISKMANELSSVFKKVRIEYIVADNHSRTTKKIEFAPGTNSYNYIVGTMTQIMLRDNKNIEFNLYPEIEHIVKVEGLNYLITHGNSIRGGQLGLPYYGMTRRLGAEAMIRMNMPEDSHFSRIVMGHYHTPLMTNGIEMTGCLSSTTAFDHASGRHSRACQSAWLVSKKFEMDYSVFWLS